MSGNRRDNPQRAVVRAESAPREGEGAQRALVAVTREIDNRLAIVGASAAAGIRPDRLKLVALGAFTRTPALWTCDPVSVARSIVEAGQLGLEPTGLLGGAYLVPRGGQCTLLVGYRGLVMLAMRSQLVQRVEARVVREKDVLDYGYGLEPYLHHVPSREADPGPYTGAYAVIFYRDGSRQFDYMSITEIEAIRKRSSAPNAGPWVTDYAEMCKKTPLRRLMKLAPLSVEVAAKLDEVDPEVPEGAAASAADGRQAELRAQLQAALDREYGVSVSEGQYTELPAEPAAQPATTQAGDGAAGEGSGAAKGAGAPQAAPGPAPTPARGGKPESAGEVLVQPAVCGWRNEALGVGPCALPANHAREMYQFGGHTYPPQQEHEEAGGTRWSQPK